jgi:hypothetical protein
MLKILAMIRPGRRGVKDRRMDSRNEDMLE